MSFFSRNINTKLLHPSNLVNINSEFKQRFVNSNNINLNFEKSEISITKTSQRELQPFVYSFSQILTQFTTQPMDKLLE